MASINLGIVGCIAASAAGSPPTGVSIATSSSGNYNNAVDIVDGSGCSFAGMDVAGDQFSTGSADHNVAIDDFQAFDGCDAASNNAIRGYIRATGATSYQWGASITSQSLSNGCSASFSGAAYSTDQDETGGSGNIGKVLVITFGGGRGGQTYPANGDTLEIRVTASATNSSGTTNASNVDVSYDFSG